MARDGTLLSLHRLTTSLQGRAMDQKRWFKVTVSALGRVEEDIGILRHPPFLPTQLDLSTQN